MRIVITIIALLFPSLSSAADTITLVTGPKTGTYYAFGQDIVAQVQNKKLKLVAKETDGSVDNIKRINGAGHTLGIVQSDVLGFLNHSQNAASTQIVSHLRIVYPFYQEEVHVLAAKTIPDFKDLQGKKVAIGEEGSGHMLTAVNLFAIEQIVPSEIKKISPEEGVAAVLRGDLDAVIFVGGKPVKIFKNLEALTKPQHQKFALLLQNVHFLPLNSPKFYEQYEPAEITPQDYNFVRATVPTVAVQAALVSYEPAGKGKKSKAQIRRCEALKEFAGALRSALPALKEKGHPKWREVNFSSETLGWEKDSCVWGKQLAAR